MKLGDDNDGEGGTTIMQEEIKTESESDGRYDEKEAI